MEKGRQIPPEARVAAISDFFDTEGKKIFGRMLRAEALVNGIDANGTVVRKQQRIQHLRDRQTELDHVEAFISRVITNTAQTLKFLVLGIILWGN